MKKGIFIIVGVMILLIGTGIYTVNYLFNRFAVNQFVAVDEYVTENVDNNREEKTTTAIIASSQEQKGSEGEISEDNIIAQAEKKEPEKLTPQLQNETCAEKNKAKPVQEEVQEEVQAQENVNEEKEQSPKALEPKSDNTIEVSRSSENEELIVNEKKIKEIQKKVSLADKSRAMLIVARSLTVEDYAYLLELSKGGVTEQDKSLAKKLLSERLTDEQKQEVKELYEKYEEFLFE